MITHIFWCSRRRSILSRKSSNGKKSTAGYRAGGVFFRSKFTKKRILVRKAICKISSQVNGPALFLLGYHAMVNDIQATTNGTWMMVDYWPYFNLLGLRLNPSKV